MAFEAVVADVIAYLDPVDGAPVSSDVPDPRPAEFVQVRRIGGGAVFPVRENVRLDVWAWAQSAPRAMELLNLARASILRLSGSNTLGYMCYGVEEFMGPTQRDDPETGLPRGWYRPELTVRADDVVHHSAP